MEMRNATGFTILELMVVMAIMGIVAAMAMPTISATRNQMRVTQATRALALTLGEVRAEAVRLKSQVRVAFSSTGISWDLFNDGSIDGTLTFSRGVTWEPSTPTTFIFDGLGLVRSLGATKTLKMKGGNYSDSVYINKNGYIWL